MANRPRGYGLTAEVKKKMAAKYDDQMEQEARLWMESVVGELMDDSVPQTENLGTEKFHAALKDGIFLCRLAEILTGTPVKYNKMKVAFKQMENIGKFLEAIEKYGVAKTDLFQTVDLYENQNLWQVVTCIHALGRKAQANGFDGPCLGPKEASKNVREFSEEQIQEGKKVIGLQMGTNKLASQSGMSFGATRHIADIKCDDMTQEGAGVIGLQAGSNKGASQAGMRFGGQRFINDLKCDDVSKEGSNVIGLQSGTNQGASQSGQSFGKSRGIIGVDK